MTFEQPGSPKATVTDSDNDALTFEPRVGCIRTRLELSDTTEVLGSVYHYVELSKDDAKALAVWLTEWANSAR